MQDWPHQIRAFEDTLAAIARGERRICLTSPTGGGKTRIIEKLARHYLDQRRAVVLYTNRKMLIDQISENLMAAGLYHGIRAADYADERDHNFQVSSIQTEHSRVFKKGRWKLHDAELVLVDEAHLNKSGTARKLLDQHHEDGAACVGLTATPLDLGDLYTSLIIAGTNSELRECGALVKAYHYGPDEPDLRHVGRVELGKDLTERQNVRAMMAPGIFGRVLESWQKLNPEQRPTILFAPGVRESIWFAEQFQANGISAAHIDGEQVWIEGKLHKSDREARKQVLDASRAGDIKVICNRFVLREGIDAPWLAHGVFATVFGSLQSYLQSGGRLLRAYPGLDHIVIQDHGGGWWRHGSLNADRQWRLDYTSHVLAGLREDAARQKREREPVRCPKCGLILSMAQCPCGFVVDLSRKSRPVIQADGTLKEMSGDIFKPRRLCTKPDGPKLWERMYYASRTETGERTFRAAEAFFNVKYDAWPDHSWPLMPKDPHDWFRLVADVPKERLTQEGPYGR